MKPHICCFGTHHHNLVKDSERTSRVDLGYSELFVEVKAHSSQDFFVDPSSDATPEDRASYEFVSRFRDEGVESRVNRALGQHCAYVTEIFARQPRVFLFSISMAGSSARLCRWDRAGVIVSESFDIRVYPDWLCEFLWRFSCVSAAERGHDTTFTLALPREETLFVDAITRHVQAQLVVEGDELTKAVSEHYKEGFVMAVDVMTSLDNERKTKRKTQLQVDRYLVSRPVISPLSPTGRGTRGYWAVHATSHQLVFLKDAWRHYRDMEGSVIAGLNKLNVCNVPSFIGADDVYEGSELSGAFISFIFPILL